LYDPNKRGHDCGGKKIKIFKGEQMREVNFDGIVGPTHNYSGLSYGNVASLTFASEKSSPKQAALQGLAKAKALSDMGLTQGVIPPQIRPDFEALRNIAFREVKTAF
jgi:succinylarginine dihydrolase